MTALTHEVIEAFAKQKLSLCNTLIEMLGEHFSHCTERRGCGYTQSTRFLSVLINQARDPVSINDLSIFADFSSTWSEQVARQALGAGWSKGWRCLDEAPDEIKNVLSKGQDTDELLSLMPRVREIARQVTLPESQLFVALLQDILRADEHNLPSINGMPAKADIGSCSMAEEFFLEIAHSRVRRGGCVNIIVDEQRKPLLVEKMSLGESHSAAVIAPIQINGVRIPAGGLLALKFHSEEPQTLGKTRFGSVFSVKQIEEARFLRLLTLSVAPVHRRRAFKEQVETQIRSNMLSPTVTSIEQLRDFAIKELKSAA